MKIVCESCGAKYSIADERINGKVFKIRCKRCSEVIIVRGDQPQPQAAEAEAAPSGDANAIWHVVVEGEQAGPYSPSQLAGLLSAGTIDWEAYVWTEGFDNWLPMRDVPDLVAQITGGGQPAAQPAAEPRGAQYRAAVQETLTGQPSMGADPFADEGPGDGGLFGGGAQSTPDLFSRSPATAASSPFASGPDSGVIASAPSPRVEAAQAMTGARNENSVLFSLKNLQALATGSASVPAAQASGAGGREGYAGGEGSGLIDIRALAAATGVGDSGDSPAPRDELLSIGTQGGAFGTLGSPMLTPARDDGDGNKKVLIWAGVAGLAFLSAAAVAIVYIMRAPAVASGPAVDVAQPPAATGAAAALPMQPQPTAQAPAPQPSEGELAAAKAAQSAKESDDERRARSEGGSRKRSSSDRGSSSAKAEDPAPTPAPAERKEPAKPSGPKSIDELLDGALSGSPSKPKPAAEPSAAKSNLPEQPSRDQVIAAMNGVKSEVSACAQGQGGVATVTVSVAGETGRVTNATVNGVTGPTGSCVAKAVRKAQFPKFQAKVFKVQFPFKL